MEGTTTGQAVNTCLPLLLVAPSYSPPPNPSSCTTTEAPLLQKMEGTITGQAVNTRPPLLLVALLLPPTLVHTRKGPLLQYEVAKE